MVNYYLVYTIIMRLCMCPPSQLYTHIKSTQNQINRAGKQCMVVNIEEAQVPDLRLTMPTEMLCYKHGHHACMKG